MENDVLFVSRDVKFVENVFPFKIDKSGPGNIFLDKRVGMIDDAEFPKMMKSSTIDESDEGSR